MADFGLAVIRLATDKREAASYVSEFASRVVHAEDEKYISPMNSLALCIYLSAPEASPQPAPDASISLRSEHRYLGDSHD
jgi:hypothetical protein